MLLHVSRCCVCCVGRMCCIGRSVIIACHRCLLLPAAYRVMDDWRMLCVACCGCGCSHAARSIRACHVACCVTCASIDGAHVARCASCLTSCQFACVSSCRSFSSTNETVTAHACNHSQTGQECHKSQSGMCLTALNPRPQSPDLNPIHYTLNPKPHPKPYTLSPKP